MVKRTNQVDRTRRAILDAASDMVFGTTNPEDFTMQNVADAAGVSHRTLYRYYDGRRALINAVGAEQDKKLGASSIKEMTQSFDRWTSSVDAIISFGTANADMLRRALALSVIGGEWRTDRDETYWGLFREAFPNLGEVEARQDFAVLRHVLWSSNAVLIGQRFELSAEAVAAGVERAIAALVDSISKRDMAELARREGS